MLATTDVGFIEMRIAKVVGFGPPFAEEPFHCVVLDEVSGTGTSSSSSGNGRRSAWLPASRARSLAVR
jgi:hypothetical protein